MAAGVADVSADPLSGPPSAPVPSPAPAQPPSSSSSSSGMSPYYVSPQDKALAAAARTYIYGKGQLSKVTFDDEEFRAMFQAYRVGGGGKGKASVLGIAAR